MTGFATAAARDMGQRLAGGYRAVMTARAIRGDRVMTEIGRNPGTAGVTVIARPCTGDVIGILAGCYRAIMTAGTASLHLGVIHFHSRFPGGNGMTGLATAAARDMAQRFAAADGPVMATRTIVGDANVIKVCRHPGTGGVASHAIRIARNMVDALASGNAAIMAARAGTTDCGVIEDNAGETAGLVAAIAFGRRLDMAWPDTLRDASVMAAAAIADDCVMIHPHVGLPDISLVTIAAGCSAGDMARRSGRCLQQRAFFMTAGTVSWRTLELPADMTTFAGQIPVRCIERETGAIVVEIIARRPGETCRATPGQQYADKQIAEVSRAALRSCFHASVSTLHPRRQLHLAEIDGCVTALATASELPVMAIIDFMTAVTLHAQ